MKKVNTKLILFFICSVVLLMLTACGSNSNSDDTEASAAASGDSDTITLTDKSTLDPAGMHHIEINVKDYGTIAVELDGDSAPVTVANFLTLVASGFYDGLTFHRIVDDFMIQGGDPEGTGYGGSDQTITGEFSANGFDNPLSHTRGAISMARSTDYDSARSQFFIVQSETYISSLDGLYACFGYVTDGMDIVDSICEDTPVQDSNGIVAAADQPVITSITIID